MRLAILTVLYGLCFPVFSQDNDKTQQKEKYLDSLKNAAKSAVGEEKLETLMSIFREYTQIDLKKAKVYALELNQAAIEQKDTIRTIISFNAMGYADSEMGLLRNAIDNFEKGLELAKLSNSRRQTEYILNNLGSAYRHVSNYPKALQYYLETLRMREEDNDSTAMGVVTNNIGLIFLALNDNVKALNYFDLSIGYEIGGSYNVATANRSIVLANLGRLKEAEEQVLEALESCSNNDCPDDKLSYILVCQGDIYFATKRYKEALISYTKSRDLCLQLGSSNLVNSLINIAKTQFELNDFETCLSTLSEAEGLANKFEIKRSILESYELYIKVYEKKEDFKKAEEFRKQYIKLYELLFNTELVTSISNLLAEYNEAKNMTVLAERDRELNIKKRETIYLWAFAIAIFLALTAFIALWLNRRMQNNRLESLVQQRTNDLSVSNQAFQRLNTELSDFIEKTAGDIVGPLANGHSLSHMAAMENKNPVIQSYLSKISDSYEVLNKILYKLQVLNVIHNSAIKPELTKINELVQDILIQEKSNIPSHITINVDIQENLIVSTDRSILYIILSNLISNATRFYNKDTTVKPQVSVRGQYLKTGGILLIIQDNGLGDDPANLNETIAMYNKAANRSEPGGITFYLAERSIKKLHGSIDLRITDNGLIEFRIYLPEDLAEGVLKSQLP